MAVQQAASTKTGMTADQVTLLTLSDLQESKDWRGVVAMEREAMTMAAEVRASIPGLAASLCGTLGIAYKSLGDFSKAIEHHTKWLAIAQEVGDRAGEGRAYGHLGAAYESLGDFAKAVKCHRQHLAIAKEVVDRAGEGLEGRMTGWSPGRSRKRIASRKQFWCFTSTSCVLCHVFSWWAN